MRRGDLPVQPAREGAPGFTLLPRGAADAPPQTRLRFSGQHRDAAVLSGSWSPDALIESLRPCRNQRGGEGRGRRGEYEGKGGGQKHTSGIRETLQTLGKPHREKRTGRVVDGGSGEKGALLCFLRYHRGGRSHGRQPPPENKSLSEKKQEERRKEKQQFSIWWGIKRRNSRLLCSSERWANKGGLLLGDGRWRGGGGVGCYFGLSRACTIAGPRTIDGSIGVKLKREAAKGGQGDAEAPPRRAGTFVWVHVSARCLLGALASVVFFVFFVFGAWAMPCALGGGTGRR